MTSALHAKEVQVRVRYNECDSMAIAHNSIYPVWMEIARTELLREQGTAYRDLEAEGVFFVVSEMNIRFRRPACYDDLLTIRVSVAEATAGTIIHQYEILRDEAPLAEARTTLVCVNREGRPRRIPSAIAEHMAG